jgi:hypothetical protein
MKKLQHLFSVLFILFFISSGILTTIHIHKERLRPVVQQQPAILPGLTEAQIAAKVEKQKEEQRLVKGVSGTVFSVLNYLIIHTLLEDDSSGY